MLAELRGEGKSGNQAPPKPFSPLVISLLVVSLFGLIITSLLIVRRKQQRWVVKRYR